MADRGRSARRSGALALVLAVAACQDSCRTEATLGPPDDPEAPGETPVVQRVLIGSGSTAPATESWVWRPGRGWDAQPVVLPAPGVGEGTIARAIRRANPPSFGSGAAGTSTPPNPTPPNLEGDAVFLAGGRGPDGALAGDQAYFFDGATDISTPFRLSRARVDHTVTALYGGRFLIVGGNDASATPTATAEVFDTEAMHLQPTGAMAEARRGHAASLLLDGRVLVTGGHDEAGLPVRRAEVWDPSTGLFSRAGTLADARVGHTQITLGDGRVLVIGGTEENRAELWDPETGNFTTSLGMISRHGVGHTATPLLDGRVLVLGGDGTDGRLQPTDQAEIYDPAEGDFVRVGPMHSARLGHFAVLLADGRVLIGGGLDESEFPTSSVEIYDPVANRFSTADDAPEAGSGAAAVFIAGGG